MEQFDCIVGQSECVRIETKHYSQWVALDFLWKI